MHLRVVGGRRLSGAIDVKTSKNACIALLCASLLNKGRTVLRRVARIEEVYRLLEVLNSIGVRTRWINDGTDLEIVPPAELTMEAIDADAARRTRSIIMFLGPLLHRMRSFKLPYAGGCDLGTRTVEPHMIALRRFGLDITATEGLYHAEVDPGVTPDRPIVLTERGDTVTENALLAAARHDGATVIRNASSNYMVQDLCFFLEALGVRVEGIGTTTPHRPRRAAHRRGRRLLALRGPGRGDEPARRGRRHRVGADGPPGAHRVPGDRARGPGEEMGLDHDRSKAEYGADNGRDLCAGTDLTVRPSKLDAPIDKIHHGMPSRAWWNIDNVPFFRGHLPRRAGQDPHPRPGLRQPRDLPDGPTVSGGRLQLLDPHARPCRGPDPLARRRDDVPRRPSARPWSSCSP